MELFKLVGEVALTGTDKVKNELDDISDKGEQSENRLVSAFKKIGGAVVAYFAVDKIISFGQELANTSATVSAENSAFAQIMGDFAQQAQSKMEEVAKATGVMSTRLTPYMTSLTAKFKGLGYGIDDATTLATEGLLLASDACAFWDMSLDESMSHLNSFINGSYEGGEAIGLFANDTQMAQYAVRTGLIESTKAWASLDEATKQATRLEYAQAMMEASGAVGQARKEAGQYANQSADLTEKWRQFKAEIGEPILQNIVVPALQKLSVIIDKLSQGYKDLKAQLEEAKKWFEENKTTIDTVIGVVEVLTASFIGLKAGMMIQSAVQGFQQAKIAISLLSLETGNANLAQLALNGTMTVWETIVALLTGKMTLAQLATGLWTKAQLALNTALTANPIGVIIMAITAVIAIIVVLWNKCDWFRNGVIAIFEWIKTAFNAVVEWFGIAIENVKNFFIGLWNKIQEVFNGIMTAIDIAVQFIGAIFNLLIDIILIPWNFIWVNFGEYIMSAINSAKEWLTGAYEFIKGIFTTIWETISSILTSIWNTISSICTIIWNVIVSIFTSIFNAIKEKVTNIWNTITSIFNSIKTTITTIVTSIKDKAVSIFTNIKDSISEKVNAVKTTVTDVFNKIKSAITEPIENAKNKVGEVVEKIKGFFNFKVTLPNIKLPHFAISPKGWELGDLLKGKIPKLGIEWYAKAMDKGMILDEPTIFGINSNGVPMGAGEAGSETVVGTNSLMNMIDKAVKNNAPQVDNSGIERKLDKIMNTMLKMKIELDDEVVGNFVVRTVEKEVFN